MEKVFTKSKLAELASTNKQNIAYWTNKNLILPSIAATKGTGNKRLYSIYDLIDTLVLIDLAKLGISQKRIYYTFDGIKDMVFLEKNRDVDLDNLSKDNNSKEYKITSERLDEFLYDEGAKYSSWSKLLLESKEFKKRSGNLDKVLVYLIVFNIKDEIDATGIEFMNIDKMEINFSVEKRCDNMIVLDITNHLKKSREL